RRDGPKWSVLKPALHDINYSDVNLMGHFKKPNSEVQPGYIISSGTSGVKPFLGRTEILPEIFGLNTDLLECHRMMIVEKGGYQFDDIDKKW
ncbi:MAG: hypothetical protein WA151_20005, partial [Desulfatirhabdiaceae bacterium]